VILQVRGQKRNVTFGSVVKEEVRKTRKFAFLNFRGGDVPPPGLGVAGSDLSVGGARRLTTARHEGLKDR